MMTLSEFLTTAGAALADPASESHREPVLRCARRLVELPHPRFDAPLAAYFVPGRVELFGKHTGYAGGRSLLCATERGFRLAAVPRDDDRIRVVSLDRDAGEPLAFSFAADVERRESHWSRYPQMVARRLARDFAAVAGAPLRGADIALTSDLPPAAGLAASSALVVACLLALAEVNRLSETALWRHALSDRLDLAGYAACIENGRSFGPLEGDCGGAFGGSESHTILLGAAAGMVSQFSFAPARRERDVAWPVDAALVVGSSGVREEKAGDRLADDERLREQAALIVREFNEARGTECATLRACVETLAAGGQTLEHFMMHLVSMRRELSSLDLPGRALQFRVEDQELVPQAAEAIAAGDWPRVGRLAERSDELAEVCLANAMPATAALRRLARLCGASAASGFGPGLGGSVWATVAADEAREFLIRWRKAYARSFPREAERSAFFITRPAGAARRLIGLGAASAGG